MSILRVDKYGRLYQSSRDRADGLGYSHHARPAEQRDLTYGCAHTRGVMGQEWRTMTEREAIATQDRQDQVDRRNHYKKLQAKRRRELTEEYAMDNDLYKRNMLRQALQMGHYCPVAERAKLEHRRRHEQMAVSNKMSGMGVDVTHRVDPQEAAQIAHQAKFANILAVQAQKDAVKLLVDTQQEERIRRQQAKYRHGNDVNASRVLRRTR